MKAFTTGDSLHIVQRNMKVKNALHCIKRKAARQTGRMVRSDTAARRLNASVTASL